MRLLLDECFPAAAAAQLRAVGHDVVSTHDPECQALEGAPDEDVWGWASAHERALVCENVADYRRLEAGALVRGEPAPQLIFTSARELPRGDPRTLARLVTALDELLRGPI